MSHQAIQELGGDENAEAFEILKPGNNKKAKERCRLEFYKGFVEDENA